MQMKTKQEEKINLFPAPKVFNIHYFILSDMHKVKRRLLYNQITTGTLVHFFAFLAFGTISKDQADCDADLQRRRRQNVATPVGFPIAVHSLCIVNACQTQTRPKTNSKQRPKRLTWPQRRCLDPLTAHPLTSFPSVAFGKVRAKKNVYMHKLGCSRGTRFV